jgi:HEAT repeat protein
VSFENMQTLIGGLLDPQSQERRIYCAYQLGKQKGEPLAAKSLISALNDLAISAVVIDALGNLADQQAVIPLVEIMLNPHRPDNWQVPKALASIGGQASIHGLMSALYMSDSKLRQEAIVALGKIRATQAISLLSMFANYDNLPIRLALATALGEIADHQATNTLIFLLDDPDYYVREAAIYSLGNLRDTQAEEKIIAKILNDSVNQSSGIIALEKIDGEVSRSFLRQFRRSLPSNI